MYRGAEIAVVVPAYDEAAHVGGVLDGLPGFVDWVFVVDDGSNDETWSVLRGRAAAIVDPPRDDATVEGDVPAGLAGVTAEPGTEAPTVVATRHARNRGVGAAVVTGYRLAMAVDADAAAVMGGDDQMDPDYLDDLLDPVVEGRAGYAKGTRFAVPGHDAGMSRFRRFGTAVLTHLTRLSTGYWNVTDTQNGYTAVSTAVLRSLSLDDLYDRYGFLNDLLAALSVADVRVVEVPHPARYGDEDSTIRYRSFVPRLSALLVTNFVARLREMARSDPRDPAVVAYSLALAAVVAGVVAVGGLAARLPGLWWSVAGPAAAAVAVVAGAAGALADAGRGQSRGNPPSREVGERGGRE